MTAEIGTAYFTGVADGTGSGWKHVAESMAASAPGVLAAILAVWLTNRLTVKRDEKNRVAERREAIRKHDAERVEAIRRESTQRRLTALEKLSAGVIGMPRDLDRYAATANLPAGTSDPSLDEVPNYQQAAALVAMYFHDRLQPEWDTFETRFLEARLAIAFHIQELRRYQADSLAQIAAHAPVPPMPASVHATSQTMVATRTQVVISQKAVIGRIRALAPELLT